MPTPLDATRTSPPSRPPSPQGPAPSAPTGGAEAPGTQVNEAAAGPRPVDTFVASTSSTPSAVPRPPSPQPPAPEAKRTAGPALDEPAASAGLGVPKGQAAGSKATTVEVTDDDEDQADGKGATGEAKSSAGTAVPQGEGKATPSPLPAGGAKATESSASASAEGGQTKQASGGAEKKADDDISAASDPIAPYLGGPRDDAARLRLVRRLRQDLLRGLLTPKVLGEQLSRVGEVHDAALLYAQTAKLIAPASSAEPNFHTVLADEVLGEGVRRLPQDGGLRQQREELLATAASRESRVQMQWRLRELLDAEEAPRLQAFLARAERADRRGYVQGGLRVAKIGLLVGLGLPVLTAAFMATVDVVVGLLFGGGVGGLTMLFAGLRVGVLLVGLTAAPMTLAALAYAGYYAVRKGAGTA